MFGELLGIYNILQITFEYFEKYYNNNDYGLKNVGIIKLISDSEVNLKYINNLFTTDDEQTKIFINWCIDIIIQFYETYKIKVILYHVRSHLNDGNDSFEDD